MSSITIEVEDPAEAYESVQAMLDAAPVDFSQVTAVRLEIEYDSETDGAETTEDDRSESNGRTGPAEPGEVDSISATDLLADLDPADGQDADFLVQDDALPDSEGTASIADAEGGTVESSADEPQNRIAGADEISFSDQPDGEPDDSVFDAPADSTDESIFGDGAPTDSPPNDSIFAADTDRSASGPDASAENSDVTFEDPDSGRRVAAEARPPTVREAQSTTAEETRTASTPSPRTYNKVMRLLQNRDFPIRRAQLEEIAAGAYDVDPDDCRTIIDAAIEKGLVEQEGPLLVDPEA
jgi:hypothetical protein